MDILNRLKMLRTEDFIWITYFFIAAFAIFSNAFERDYVKTNNVILKGSMPVDAMDRIKQMFNTGIRFWHGDFVGDYSRSNRPLLEVK